MVEFVKKVTAFRNNHKKIVSFAGYMGFLACWCAFLILTLNPNTSFVTQRALDIGVKGIWQDVPMADFENIATEQDVWDYLQVAIVKGLWYPSTYPNNSFFVFKNNSRPDKREKAYIRKFNVNLGVLVSQTRRRVSTKCRQDKIKQACWLDATSDSPGVFSSPPFSPAVYRRNFTSVDASFSSMFKMDNNGADSGQDIIGDGTGMGDYDFATLAPTPAPTATGFVTTKSPTPSPTAARKRYMPYPEPYQKRSANEVLEPGPFEKSFLESPYFPGQNIFSFYLDRDFSGPSILKLLKRYREYLWIDLATEQVELAIPVYNVNLGIFITEYVTFDFDEGGGITASTSSSNANPLSQSDDTYIAIVILLALSCLGIAVMVFGQVCAHLHTFRTISKRSDVRGVEKVKLLATSSLTGSRILVSAIIVLMIMAVITWISLQSQCDVAIGALGALLEGDSNEATIIDVLSKISLAGTQTDLFIIFASLATLLLFMQGIRHFDLSANLGLLGEVLGRAASSLASFTVIFLYLFSAFVVVGHIVFGSVHDQFKTFPLSIMGVTQLLFGSGAFNYQDLADANSVIAPVYFWAFNLLTVLVLTNVFVAILSEFYATSKERRIAEYAKQGIIAVDDGHPMSPLTFVAVDGQKVGEHVAKASAAADVVTPAPAPAPVKAEVVVTPPADEPSKGSEGNLLVVEEVDSQRVASDSQKSPRKKAKTPRSPRKPELPDDQV